MSNWADLPGELLTVILSNLFGKDVHSFSLVCRPWNTVAENSPYRYSPCLMYYYQRTGTWKFYRCGTFFDFSFPDLENAEIRCSKYGWLLMSRHDGTLFFFDPSSNCQKVELPGKLDGHGYTSLSFFNPPTSPDCVVVGIKTPPWMLGEVGICTLKRGEDTWEHKKYPTKERNFLASLGAPVLHRGLIYFLSFKGDVATLDIERGSLRVYSNCMSRRFIKKSLMEIDVQYLVKVNGEEELYCVFVFRGERKVNVFRLQPRMKWCPVKGIGGKVMYLSHTSSFGDEARTESLENTIRFPEFHGDVAAFYSLGDAKYHSLDGDFSDASAYGLKRFDFSAWLMPFPAPEELITQMSWL